ncbi:hypothetical protein I1E95_08055 [Synechococcus sp. CBW1107]|uniref:hypothetical protein n=1 Tax=Synechococcus sp. CBW1107 TaxID=2789857 RepID=UPI0018CEC1AF|nr:hypothetical protein [Synechococcus sp. CBW1107]QPN57983.1 hypothetical protein I1E95_08055 [Synechococcus sp. CBW1107]CAK6688174.1 hypothetical protein BBFGKLBO_00361 [Synechococcus sp. CBW1107]
MTSSGFDQTYKRVELAYSQGRFAEALQEGQDLLEGTPLEAGDPHSLRLKLLLGHIHFYGLRQPDEAGELYRQVLTTATRGSTYSDLAAEGLALCEQSKPEANPAAAMPWAADLQSVGSAPLSLAPAPPDSDMEAVRVEVLDEPAASVHDGAGRRRFSPEEEAELAKGLLRVVLG